MKYLSSFLFAVILCLSSCSNSPQAPDPVPQHETFSIYSNAVAEERVINIWIPENYTTSSDTLPVMYMLDGGIKEDFPHVANTIARLIKEQKINPLLLVGIENTQRRRDLTGFTEIEKDKEIAPIVGGAEKFRTFIREELFPEIANRYRTTTEKSIIGESLAGLFVVETFLLQPAMFHNYIAFDPSLWWNHHTLVKTAKEHLATSATVPKRIWFAGSSATDIIPYTRALAAILTTEKYTPLQWHYADEPNEEHATIFRATKEKALIWALNKEGK